MKRCLFLWGIATFGASALISCSKDSPQADIAGPETATALTVAEARAAFESEFGSLSVTRSEAQIDSSDYRRIATGDFTPVWDIAQLAGNDFVSAVDVPIIAEQQYIALVRISNRTFPAQVPVQQHLTIIKNKQTGEPVNIISASIPDPHYYLNSKKNNYVHFSEEYSGIVLSKTLYGQVYQVTKYDKGQIVANIHMQDTTKYSQDILVQQANLMLANIVILPYNGVKTRGYGEMGGGGSIGGGGGIIGGGGGIIGSGGGGSGGGYEGGGNPNIGQCVLCGLYHSNPGSCQDGIVAPGKWFCTECGQQGHYAKNCPNKICPECKGVGTCWCCTICHKYPCQCFQQPPSNACSMCGFDPCRCAKCAICGLTYWQCSGHGGIINPPVDQTPDLCNVCNHLRVDCVCCPTCHLYPCKCPEIVPCDDIASQNALLANSTFTLLKNTSQYKEFGKLIPTASFEYGISFSTSRGVSSVVYTDNKTDQIQPRTIDGMDAMAHNHPGATPPSAGDVISLISTCRLRGYEIDKDYICASNGEIYILIISDRDKAKSQLSRDLKELKQRITDYTTSVTNILEEYYHYDRFTAREYALAFALQDIDVGIKLLKKDANSQRFRQLNAEEDFVNPDPYCPISIKISKCQ